MKQKEASDWVLSPRLHLQKVVREYQQTDPADLQSYTREPFFFLSKLSYLFSGTYQKIEDFSAAMQAAPEAYQNEDEISKRIEKLLGDPATRDIAVQAILYSVRYFLQNPDYYAKVKAPRKADQLKAYLQEVRPLQEILTGIRFGFVVHSYAELCIVIELPLTPDEDENRELVHDWFEDPRSLIYIDKLFMKYKNKMNNVTLESFQNYLIDQREYLDRLYALSHQV